MRIFSCLLFFLLVALVACIENPDESKLISFVSLNAEQDTILTGQSTKINAEVEGQNVTFKWNASAGDLLGSGNEVSYVAPPCTPGNNSITCTAFGDNKSESKTIIITVF